MQIWPVERKKNGGQGEISPSLLTITIEIIFCGLLSEYNIGMATRRAPSHPEIFIYILCMFQHVIITLCYQ